MADQNFEDTDLVVIERGPLRGVDSKLVYFGRMSDARAYVDTRRGLFEHIDVCRVLTRVSTALAPVETIEGNPI